MIPCPCCAFADHGLSYDWIACNTWGRSTRWRPGCNSRETARSLSFLSSERHVGRRSELSSTELTGSACPQPARARIWASAWPRPPLPLSIRRGRTMGSPGGAGRHSLVRSSCTEACLSCICDPQSAIVHIVGRIPPGTVARRRSPLAFWPGFRSYPQAQEHNCVSLPPSISQTGGDV